VCHDQQRDATRTYRFPHGIGTQHEHPSAMRRHQQAARASLFESNDRIDDRLKVEAHGLLGRPGEAPARNGAL